MTVTAVPVTYSTRTHRAQPIDPTRSSQATIEWRPAGTRIAAIPARTMNLLDTEHSLSGSIVARLLTRPKRFLRQFEQGFVSRARQRSYGSENRL
jgi:hypothetical protein